MQFYLIPMQV